MESFLREWVGWVPDWQQVTRASVRLLAALAAGALIGVQRELSRKPAGLRTHMLVALGTAAVVVASIEYGMQFDALSRVIQGLLTGIGFIGAGTILKLTGEHEVIGLTTASSVWMTAAISVAIGLGQFALAFIAAALTWLVLAVLITGERRLERRKDPDGD